MVVATDCVSNCKSYNIILLAHLVVSYSLHIIIKNLEVQQDLASMLTRTPSNPLTTTLWVEVIILLTTAE